MYTLRTFRLAAAGITLSGAVACIGGGAISAESVSADASSAASQVSPLSSPLSACTGQAQAAPLQRLTQQQYTNRVPALLQLPSPPAAQLPADEAIGAFAVNTVASVGDFDISLYMTSAQTLSQGAMGNLAKLLPCDPSALTATCTTAFITQFGKATFRRPLDPNELAGYQAVANTYASSDPNGIRLVISAMLQSPYFLYRPEFGDASNATAQVLPLSQYEKATRLAFLLWNSGPDSTLLTAADANGLVDPNSVRTQADRLTQDPRFGANVAGYVIQLLALQGLPAVAKSAAAYPSFNPNLLAAMGQETTDFVNYVMTEGDGTLNTMLTAPYSILTDPLFAYYGVTKPDNFVVGSPVQLPAGQRAGLLTQGAFLSLYGHEATSDPVHRGKIIRENLLCQGMPAPPPGVNATPPAVVPSETTRQVLLGHETNASCAACHVLMDHIGFAFENYDGMGSWRLTDNGQPVDASGNIIATAATNVSFNGAIALNQVLAKSPDVNKCVALQTFRFGLSRAETPQDACTLKALAAGFNASGGNLREILLDVAASNAFLNLTATGN